MAIYTADFWAYAGAPAMLAALLLAFCTAEVFGRRRASPVNLAIKYGLGAAIAIGVFWLCGFGLAYGMSFLGVFGLGGFLPGIVSDQPASLGFFANQAVLAAAAMFILFGAQARRMTLRGYVLAGLFFASVVYPVTTHWIWGSYGGAGQGWLRAAGFIDQAGAAAVHMVGGWAALAVSLALGPRKPFKVNLPCNFTGPYTAACSILSLGFFLLCWGAFLSANMPAMAVPSNAAYLKLFAAAGAALVTASALVLFRRRFFGFWYSLRAAVAGLVAVSAGIDVLSLEAAIVIGGLAAVITMALSHLLYRLSVEDAASTAAVHLGGGLTGTLLLPLMVSGGMLGAGNTAAGQLLVQLQGALALGLFVFGSVFAFLKLLLAFTAVRISDRELLKKAQSQFKGARGANAGAATPPPTEIDEMDLPAAAPKNGTAAQAGAAESFEAGPRISFVAQMQEPDGEEGQAEPHANAIADEGEDEGEGDEEIFADARPDFPNKPMRDFTPTDILEIKIQNESLTRSLRRQSNDLEQSRRELQSLNNQLNDLTSAFVMSERTKHSLFRLSQNIFSAHIQDMQALTGQANSPRAMEKLPHLIHEKSIEHAKNLAALKALVDAMEASLPRDQQDIDLKRLMEGVKMKYQDRIFSKELILNLRYDSSILGVRGNAQNLRVIVEQLFERAINDNTSGGLLHIEVALDEQGGVSMEFVDSGRGYTAEELAEALDPLNLADDPARDIASVLGYGLVRRLVELHRGALKVTSQAGVGTKVIVSWPQEKTRLAPLRSEAAYV